MKFGYFTLSDNRYVGNTRTPEQHVRDIYAQALHAERIGLNSAWIGEHHFNLLGVNACPNMLLAQIAGATSRIRLAPAIVLLPVHHPLHVAEEWATLDLVSGGRVDFAAGRGYDRLEYAPFGADFDNSAELFAEGMDIVWRAWTEPGKWSHKGKYYAFDNIEVRPRPAQSPLRPYIACFSRLSMELAARNDWHIIFAPFAAAMVYGSLAQGVEAYRAECAKHGRAPRNAMCSYFVHIADNKAADDFGRSALLRYFLEIVDILGKMKAENLTSKSILVGSPQKIVDDLKAVEAAGISEVILYFNYGLKPHGMVLDQMSRFAAEVAPAFAGRPAPAMR
jgi:alkanesulfonate monooxygenase SsuD/methylene tetrahydromethanopterin reductase-like flavin-dependent oxidoreductase (luciferase family)